jgi:hypothetical protein
MSPSRTYVGAALDEIAYEMERDAVNMSLDEACRHLKTRSELTFDGGGGTKRHRISWSVADAHAARLVLYELARLRRLKGVS